MNDKPEIEFDRMADGSLTVTIEQDTNMLSIALTTKQALNIGRFLVWPVDKVDTPDHEVLECRQQ